MSEVPKMQVLVNGIPVEQLGFSSAPTHEHRITDNTGQRCSCFDCSIRRGENWTPPTDPSLRCFVRSDGEHERCVLCGKHVRDHYGGTQYRCDPVPDHHPDSTTKHGDLQTYLGWRDAGKPASSAALPSPIRLAVLPGYEKLAEILDAALAQAQSGKGAERHEQAGERFEHQTSCRLAELLESEDYLLGQACKKLIESKRLDDERGRADLLGAINYAAMALIRRDAQAGKP